MDQTCPLHFFKTPVSNFNWTFTKCLEPNIQSFFRLSALSRSVWDSQWPNSRYLNVGPDRFWHAWRSMTKPISLRASLEEHLVMLPADITSTLQHMLSFRRDNNTTAWGPCSVLSVDSRMAFNKPVLPQDLSFRNAWLTIAVTARHVSFDIFILCVPTFGIGTTLNCTMKIDLFFVKAFRVGQIYVETFRLSLGIH